MSKFVTNKREIGRSASLRVFFQEVMAYIEELFDPNVKFKVDTLQFNQNPQNPLEVASMQWDQEAMTIQVGMPGGTVKGALFQEQLEYVKNLSGTTITNGQVVYLSQAQGRWPVVSLANASLYSKSFVLGVATEDILKNEFGWICTQGKVHGIDTSMFDEDATKPLWLATTDGGLTQTRPEAPNMSIFIGYVLYSHQNEGEINIRPTLVPRMSGLSDVYGNTTESGQFYKWNQTTLRYEMRTDWDDLRITPGAFTYAGVNDPTLIDWQPGGSGAIIKAWAFLQGKIAYFAVQLPHGYYAGQNIFVHVHWTPHSRGTAEAGKTVAWKCALSWANYNGNFTPVTVYDLTTTCDGTNDKHQKTADVEIIGTGKGISSMIVGTVYRDSGDTWAGLTAANSPILLEVDFHIPNNTIGSKTTTSKY